MEEHYTPRVMRAPYESPWAVCKPVSFAQVQ